MITRPLVEVVVSERKKKLILKIIVPLMIVAVVVGMWVIKNSSEKENIVDNQNRDEQVQDIPEELQSADFP